MARLNLDNLADYIQYEIGEGNRLNFEGFSVSTLLPGEYFVLIKCRGKQGYPLVSTRKKVTVLPAE